MKTIDTHLIKRSLTGPEDECGDTGVIGMNGDTCFLALVDVLGHGKEAHDVAVVAERFLEENRKLDLVDLMKGLHAHLNGTRGAVAGLCSLNLKNGEMEFVGVGNITVRLYGTSPVSFVSRDGVIGYNMTAPKKQRAQAHAGDILVLTSDGVKERFDPVFYPDLLKGSAKTVATNIMEQLGKGTDDASCIVLRYGP